MARPVRFEILWELSKKEAVLGNGDWRPRKNHFGTSPNNMKIINDEGHFKTRDDLLLFYQSWKGAECRGPAIVLVHGFSEHGGRFDWLAKRLAAQGWPVYAYDQRGHGKSEGLRAFFRKEALVSDDLRRFLDLVGEKESGTILLGQGLGATLALYHWLRQKPSLKGLVLCAPNLRWRRRLSFAQKMFGLIITFLMPTVSTPEFLFKQDPASLSRRKAAIRDYVNDPFVYHGKMRNRTLRVLNRAMRYCRKNFDKVTAPILILQGAADAVVDPQTSRDLFRHAPVKDKTLKVYANGYHDLFHDQEREKALKTLASWLKKRI